MSTSIHPTAVIEDGAEIGTNVTIGPFCVVGSKVTLGDGVTLKSHVALEGRTSLGANCTVFPFASLGSAPQDLKYSGEDTALVIGENNTIREHVTMNPGTVQGNGETVVGNNCLFMMSSHVAHDCIVGDNVILANNATLAGHVTLGDYVILGGLSAVHQFVRIGDHAIIGGMSGVESDVIPFGRVKGERAHMAGLNLIGLERRGFSRDDLRTMQRAFGQLFGADGTLDERIAAVANDYADNQTIMKIVEFAKVESKFPLCQPKKKN